MIHRSILLAALALAPGSVFSQEDGSALFAENCATCHGVNGQGDGPMIPMLSVSVPDLTSLSSRNEDVFPLRLVIETISGNAIPIGHGGTMPVFGDLQKGASVVVQTPKGVEIQTRAPILALARYLEALQAP